MLTEGMFVGDRYEIVNKIELAECQMYTKRKIIHLDVL